MTAAPAWRPAPVPPSAARLAADGVVPRLAPLLARRGVADGAEAARFLAPSLDQLHDPFLLAGMEEAVAVLLAARAAGEKVAVVGDYDVDGVSATALLSAVLGACGLAVEPILPHRLREGYGFQPVHVERAAAVDCRLVVTADCGTSAAAAIAAAGEAGMAVIVTDHHLPGADPPRGALLINPRQEGCSYPFPDLAGVGIAFKLATALAARVGRAIPPAQLLRMACLGTIADLVPLVGENRVIAALGLAALSQTRSPGLKALFRKAAVDPPLSAGDVAFRIAPRLNAAGRLADAAAALDLLLTRDEAVAGRLAEELDRQNRERQAEENHAVEEARARFAERRPSPPIAVLWAEGWHRGVVGIAAGRLAREFHRPALLLAVEDGVAVGSGRSVPGIALHGFLARWEARLARFGGHAQAVGLSVAAADLPALAGEWEAAAGEWPAELLVRSYEYELELAPREVTPELTFELARLEPHGQGNPQPLVRIGPLRTVATREFGRGHLSLATTGDDGAPLTVVAWGKAGQTADFAGRFEVLGNLEWDRFRRQPSVRLVAFREV